MSPGGKPFGNKRGNQPPSTSMQPVKPHPTTDEGGVARSGGKLGAVAHNPGVTTGMHFGHHKEASPKPQQQAGMAVQINRPTGDADMANSPGITYLPDIDTFLSQTADIYSWGAGPPPIPGNKRSSNVNILITGTYFEGMRQKVNAADCYTHVIIVDANVEIRDNYQVGGQQGTGSSDLLTIPSGQTGNYWIVRFSFVTQLPGMGRKKIILADRQACSDFTKLV
jgi:hypothetical protein